MITIEKIIERYEEQYGDEATQGVFTDVFEAMSFKEKFEVLENAQWRDIVIEYDDELIDGWKIVYTGEKDKDFDFLQLLKDIETED